MTERSARRAIVILAVAGLVGVAACDDDGGGGGGGITIQSTDSSPPELQAERGARRRHRRGNRGAGRRRPDPDASEPDGHAQPGCHRQGRPDRRAARGDLDDDHRQPPATRPMCAQAATRPCRDGRCSTARSPPRARARRPRRRRSSSRPCRSPSGSRAPRPPAAPSKVELDAATRWPSSRPRSARSHRRRSNAVWPEEVKSLYRSSRERTTGFEPATPTLARLCSTS